MSDIFSCNVADGNQRPDPETFHIRDTSKCPNIFIPVLIICPMDSSTPVPKCP